jgi:hypothetical protein
MRSCRRKTRVATTDRVGAAEVVTFLALGALLVAAVLATGEPTVPDVSTVTVRIEAGDSLWVLATRYPVKGLSTEQTVRLAGHRIASPCDGFPPLEGARGPRISRC